MTIQPITDSSPLCWGVMCELHARCARYLSIDRMPAGSIVIGTCATHSGTRPMFVQAKAAEA